MVDAEHVETQPMAAPLRVRHQQVAGCTHEFALFANVHRLAGAGESSAGAGTHFDDDQRGAVEADEIQFTEPAPISLNQYLQALPLEIPCRALFPGDPAFGPRGGAT